ncbi:MAG: hypothetical protein IJB84_04090 [Lachnospiraceae bacterium]|nr:hypothetical protein [Lachnospiraceae bacterium]
MRKKILNNWGLKLISLGIAMSLWFLAMQIDDPQDKSTFSDVPVTFINTSVLEEQNLAYEVVEGTDKVRVTVRAPKSIINKLREGDIVATADVSKMTEDNQVPISYTVQNMGANKNEIRVDGSIDMAKLHVEEKNTVWVPIEYKTTGEVAEGYIVSAISTDQTNLEISGAKSLTEKVDYAEAVINVNGATRDVSANIGVVLYDKEGEVMDIPVLYENLNKVHIEVEILFTKEVPLEAAYIGKPANGYVVSGEVVADIPQIKIAGRPFALAGISKIVVPAEEFDVTDRTSDLVKSVNIRDSLPNNVRFADNLFNGKVSFTVEIEPSVSKRMDISSDQIVVENLPADFEARMVDSDKTYSIKVSGTKAAVSALAAEDVLLEVDVADWLEKQKITSPKPGRYAIPAKIVAKDVVLEEGLAVNLMLTKKENKGE